MKNTSRSINNPETPAFLLGLQQSEAKIAISYLTHCCYVIKPRIKMHKSG